MIAVIPPGLINVFSAVVGISTIAGVLWWLRRKPRKIYPFPLLNQLNLRPSPHLRLTWQPPPWGLFWCWLGCALLASILALKPTWQALTTTPAESPSYLWIIDLSPSVSARITIEAYSQLLKRHAQNLTPNSTIAILTSRELKPQPAIPAREFNGLDQDFHPPGFNGAQLLAELKHEFNQYSATTIFTDSSPESWQHPLESAPNSTIYHTHNIRFHRIEAQKPATENLFITRIQRRGRHNLNVTLTRRVFDRNHLNQPATGNLQLHHGWSQLKDHPESNPLSPPNWHQPNHPPLEFPYHFPAQTDEITLTLKDPTPPATSPPNLNTSTHWPEDQPIIHLEIKPHTPDLIALDNHYYHISQPNPPVLLVGSTLGEATLTDPLHPHLTSLKLLGFNTTRIDHWRSSSQPYAITTDINESPRALLFLTEPSLPTLTSSSQPIICPTISSTTNLKQVIILPARSTLPPHLGCSCAQQLMSPFHTLPCPHHLTTPASLADHLLNHGFTTIITAPETISGQLMQSPVVLASTTTSNHPRVIISVWPMDPYHHDSHTPSLTSHDNLMLTLKQLLHQPIAPTLSRPPYSTHHRITDITQALLQLNLTTWPHPTHHNPPWNNVPQPESLLLTPAMDNKHLNHPTMTRETRQPQPPAHPSSAYNPLPLIIILLICCLLVMEIVISRTSTPRRTNPA